MNPINLPVAELRIALTGLSKVISRRSSLPVLGHVRVERTSSGAIELAGTDLDYSVVVRLDIPGEGEPCTILVPFDELQKITKGCAREDTLLVSSTGDKVALRYPVAGNPIEYQCATLPPEEFPAIPAVMAEPVRLEEAVRLSIQQALECASTDETRIILKGVYVDVSKPGAHHVIATNGRVLFSSNSFTLPLPESVLIPSHRFLSWKPFGGAGDWTLRVGAVPKDGPQLIEIANAQWRLIARVHEGNYPNWRQVMPDRDSFKTKLTVDPAAVETVIKTIAQLPDDDEVNHVIGLESAGTVRLLARSGGTELAPVELTGVATTGKDVRVSLNRRYLTMALRFGLNQIDITDSLSPLCFSNGGRQMVVMPTRPTADPIPAAPAAPTTPPAAEQPKEPAENGNTNGTPPNETADTPALETALSQIDNLRGEFRKAFSGLAKLSDTLKAAQREHKASDKEIHSVRQTLRSLQSVKI